MIKCLFDSCLEKKVRQSWKQNEVKNVPVIFDAIVNWERKNLFLRGCKWGKLLILILISRIYCTLLY